MWWIQSIIFEVEVNRLIIFFCTWAISLLCIGQSEFLENKTLHRTSTITLSHENVTFVTKSEGKKYECFQWHSMLKTIKKVTAFLISFFFFFSTDHRKKLETKQELVLVSSLKEWQCMKVLAPTQLIFNYWLKRHIVKKRTEARFTKINFLSNKIIFHLSFSGKKVS